MIGYILGFILFLLLAIFTYCSCKVASWSDQEMEKYLKEEDEDEKETL